MHKYAWVTTSSVSASSRSNAVAQQSATVDNPLLGGVCALTATRSRCPKDWVPDVLLASVCGGCAELPCHLGPANWPPGVAYAWADSCGQTKDRASPDPSCHPSSLCVFELDTLAPAVALDFSAQCPTQYSAKMRIYVRRIFAAELNSSICCLCR